MPRKRMIDPNIWEDPDFATLSMQARLLFIGMISNADDYGYMRGHAGSLRRLVFGFDDLTASDTQVLINEIADKLHSVHVYESDNQTYIHLNNWFKYQKQQKDRLQPSLFPECSKCLTSANQMLTQVKLSKLSKEKLDEISVGKESKREKPNFVSTDVETDDIPF